MPFLRHIRSRQVTAAVEALQVLGAGIDGEGVEAKAIGGDVQAVGLSIEIIESSVIAVFALDAPEFLDDRAAHLRISTSLRRSPMCNINKKIR